MCDSDYQAVEKIGMSKYNIDDIRRMLFRKLDARFVMWWKDHLESSPNSASHPEKIAYFACANCPFLMSGHAACAHGLAHEIVIAH